MIYRYRATPFHLLSNPSFTNQLTRQTLLRANLRHEFYFGILFETRAADRYYRLALAVDALSTRIQYEETFLISSQLM